MSAEAYLKWEPRQELRYEFVNGQVFAMAGGTIAHNDIAVNLLMAVRPLLRKQGCRINIADVKVHITSKCYRYPDLVITCDKRDSAASDAIRYPKLIVEVLSPSTEAVDRGDKLKEYRSLSTLEEYVLVDATQMSVEIYRRGEGRFWLYTSYQSVDNVRLESIDFECPIGLLYEGLTQLE